MMLLYQEITNKYQQQIKQKKNNNVCKENVLLSLD